jgi:hypothetical protein
VLVDPREARGRFVAVEQLDVGLAPCAQPVDERALRGRGSVVGREP